MQRNCNSSPRPPPPRPPAPPRNPPATTISSIEETKLPPPPPSPSEAAPTPPTSSTPQPPPPPPYSPHQTTAPAPPVPPRQSPAPHSVPQHSTLKRRSVHEAGDFADTYRDSWDRADSVGTYQESNPAKIAQSGSGHSHSASISSQREGDDINAESLASKSKLLKAAVSFNNSTNPLLLSQQRIKRANSNSAGAGTLGAESASPSRHQSLSDTISNATTPLTEEASDQPLTEEVDASLGAQVVKGTEERELHLQLQGISDEDVDANGDGDDNHDGEGRERSVPAVPPPPPPPLSSPSLPPPPPPPPLRPASTHEGDEGQRISDDSYAYVPPEEERQSSFSGIPIEGESEEDQVGGIEMQPPSDPSRTPVAKGTGSQDRKEAKARHAAYMPRNSGLNTDATRLATIEASAQLKAAVSRGLQNKLLDGEAITGTFEYCYPDNREQEQSLSATLMWIVVTLGLYLVVLCLRYIARAICCCCYTGSPSVCSTSGKMVVTSCGRLLCWEITVGTTVGWTGRKQTCTIASHVLKVDDIAEISIFFNNPSRALQCGSRKKEQQLQQLRQLPQHAQYSAGIDVAFYAYTMGQMHPRSQYIFCYPSTQYAQQLNHYFQQTLMHSSFATLPSLLRGWLTGDKTKPSRLRAAGAGGGIAGVGAGISAAAPIGTGIAATAAAASGSGDPGRLGTRAVVLRLICAGNDLCNLRFNSAPGIPHTAVTGPGARTTSGAGAVAGAGSKTGSFGSNLDNESVTVQHLSRLLQFNDEVIRAFNHARLSRRVSPHAPTTSTEENIPPVSTHLTPPIPVFLSIDASSTERAPNHAHFVKAPLYTRSSQYSRHYYSADLERELTADDKGSVGVETASGRHLFGISTIYSELSDFRLVDNDGDVTVPRRWIPLLEGEEFIAAVGQFRRASYWEKLASFFTLGLFYRLVVLPKISERSAIILTTHRIIEVQLLDRFRGRLPRDLQDVRFFVRSYFPQRIQSAFSLCTDSCGAYNSFPGPGYQWFRRVLQPYRPPQRLYASLLTSFGHVLLVLPPAATSFVQRLHTVPRAARVPGTLPSEKSTKMAEHLPSSDGSMDSESTVTLSRKELTVLTLPADEKIIHRLQNDRDWGAAEDAVQAWRDSRNAGLLFGARLYPEPADVAGTDASFLNYASNRCIITDKRLFYVAVFEDIDQDHRQGQEMLPRHSADCSAPTGYQNGESTVISREERYSAAASDSHHNGQHGQHNLQGQKREREKVDTCTQCRRSVLRPVSTVKAAGPRCIQAICGNCLCDCNSYDENPHFLAWVDLDSVRGQHSRCDSSLINAIPTIAPGGTVPNPASVAAARAVASRRRSTLDGLDLPDVVSVPRVVGRQGSSSSSSSSSSSFVPITEYRYTYVVDTQCGLSIPFQGITYNADPLAVSPPMGTTRALLEGSRGNFDKEGGIGAPDNVLDAPPSSNISRSAVSYAGKITKTEKILTACTCTCERAPPR